MTKNMSKQTPSKRGPRKYWVYLRDALIGIVIISAIMYWQSKDMLSADGSVHIAQQNLVSLNGEVLPLLAQDKANLVYFFAPWCSICALSIGNLSYLDPSKVNVVIVALDYSNKEAVETFVNEHKLNSQVLMGHDALKSQFQIQGYPSYYLVDENGIITSRSFGYSTAVGLKLREVFGA
jgi:thiol-disulfide isomerase/thioredoxin